MNKLNKNIIVLILLLMITYCQTGLANTDKKIVERFMSAMQQAYQPQKSPQAITKQLDAYFAFMAEDITDYHAAYGVTIKGTEKSRNGLQQKALDSISYELTIKTIIIGTDTAIIEFKEDAKYIKNGKPKHFLGRNIMLLEFNDDGLIQHIRRYLD